MREIVLNDLPPAIVDALNTDAEAADQSVNATAVGVLAARYGVAYEGTGTFTRPLAGDRLNLRVSDKLHKALHAHRVATGNPVRGLVIVALAEHYKLEGLTASRQPRTTRA